MEPVLRWLADNSYVLLFVVVAMANLVGRVSIKGYSHGMVAAAIVVGAAVAAWASVHRIRMKFDDFTKALFWATTG